MHELLILKIIEKKMDAILDRIKTDFKSGEAFWDERPRFYNEKSDCAIGVFTAFKHLENTDDEGLVLEVHIDKQPSPAFAIDIYTIRSNGTAVVMEEVSIDLREKKEIIAKAVEEVFDLIDQQYAIMKELIEKEYMQHS